MKISIAMATYNGASYIEEQLESFARQTRPPDELVVFDDRSEDETLLLLDDFRQEAEFAVYIRENEQRLGVRDNVSRALEACAGDYIFLADQDDVWFPEKIERMVDVAEGKRGMGLVVCDAQYANSDLSELGETKLAYVRRVKREQSADHNTGCCTMISRAFAELALPIPSVKAYHDRWLHELARCMGVRRVIEEVLQVYRRHGANESKGVMADAPRAGRIRLLINMVTADTARECERRERSLEAIAERAPKGVGLLGEGSVEECLRYVEEELQAVRVRRELLGKPRVARPVSALRAWRRGDYGYFSGWRSLAKDCLV